MTKFVDPKIIQRELKKLVKTTKDFRDIRFNPSSHPQLAKFLFETLNQTNNHINMYNNKTKKCINAKS